MSVLQLVLHVVLTPNIESREMIDGGLGVVYVLVHHKGGPASVLVFLSEPYLIDGTVFPKYPVEFFGRHGEGKIADVQYPIDFRRKPGLFLFSRVSNDSESRKKERGIYSMSAKNRSRRFRSENPIRFMDSMRCDGHPKALLLTFIDFRDAMKSLMVLFISFLRRGFLRFLVLLNQYFFLLSSNALV
jgi:hypothetical protein